MLTDNNATNKDALLNQPLVIPVIEEQLVVTKGVIETGRIKVSKQIAETNETIEVPLSHDEYEITHKPVNQFVEEDNLPTIRYEENLTIIPVLKEIIVKRTLLVEEIWVTKRIITTTEIQEVLLRKEVVTIEQVQ